jgi:hypothetical protein
VAAHSSLTAAAAPAASGMTAAAATAATATRDRVRGVVVHCRLSEGQHHTRQQELSLGGTSRENFSKLFA